MKRTLVISNACFSNTISNGRTLAGLFEGADPDKIAQFFVYGEPDSDVCSRYYKVSDRDALKSVVPFQSYGGEVTAKRNEKKISQSQGANASKKTPTKILLRELIWKIGGWKNKKLKAWLDDFRPEIICLFLANNVFLIRFAMQIARKYNISIVVYTTEGYCFMDFNYLTNKPSIAYRIYYHWLSKAYEKVSKYVIKGFYNCTVLRDAYKNRYGYECSCIMNTSKITFDNHAMVTGDKKVKVSYLGNLGLNRHKALIEIAEALQRINNGYHVDVYGAIPNEQVREAFEACDAVQYRGFVSYEEVKGIIHDSTLLLHVEYDDPIMSRDLKYAFSTKIADCISSGTPMLMYANSDLAGTVFLRNNDCAFVVSRKDELEGTLRKALFDEEQRLRVVQNAQVTKDRYLTGNAEFLNTLQ